MCQFLRERRFFSMIIPAGRGGMGHAAQASVFTRIATVNMVAAVTVMVSNPRGPAEQL